MMAARRARGCFMLRLARCGALIQQDRQACDGKRKHRRSNHVRSARHNRILPYSVTATILDSCEDDCACVAIIEYALLTPGVAVLRGSDVS